MARLLIDVICPSCNTVTEDVFVTDKQYPNCPCGGVVERLWRRTAPVHGDEIDVTVEHGLCHADGSPRRFTSRSEMNRVAKERGLVNYVRHVSTRDGDRSRHTQRFL